MKSAVALTLVMFLSWPAMASRFACSRMFDASLTRAERLATAMELAEVLTKTGATFKFEESPQGRAVYRPKDLNDLARQAQWLINKLVQTPSYKIDYFSDSQDPMVASNLISPEAQDLTLISFRGVHAIPKPFDQGEGAGYNAFLFVQTKSTKVFYNLRTGDFGPDAPNRSFSTQAPKVVRLGIQITSPHSGWRSTVDRFVQESLGPEISRIVWRLNRDHGRTVVSNLVQVHSGTYELALTDGLSQETIADILEGLLD